MKKLLFLLSNSILFSLSALFIYNLNSKNNSENSSFVLKQTKKEETDLSKIFDYQSYISVKDRSTNTKAKAIDAIKLKYPSVEISELEFEIKAYSNGGGVDVIITPKTNSTKYTKMSKIPIYNKENIKDKLKDLELNFPINIEINNAKTIFKTLKDKGLSSQPEVDFKIKNIKEKSAILSSTEVGDFYGEVQIEFNSKILTLNSIIRENNIKIENPKSEEVIKELVNKYPSLKTADLKVTIEEQKKTLVVSANNTHFDGTVTLTYTLPNIQLPKKSKPDIIDKSKLDNDKENKSKDLKGNEIDSQILSDQPQETPNKPSGSLLDKNEPKDQPESPLIQSNPENNQPESNSDKTMNYNPPVIDKSLKSNSNTSNLQIPNKESSNSKTGSKGSKTGVIVGSTLGVSGVVVTGAIGSWIYFKKRK
uniref:Uncharacterized protein n=1 Tax=Mycoplasma feriruminatoris TaxID=1179777 RepID=A0A654IMP6_9MOLU|nr:hypothetical protein MF5582_00391 [Mycoplasma feriruminatoris]